MEDFCAPSFFPKGHFFNCLWSLTYRRPPFLNLETSVGREKDVRALDVAEEFEKFVVTLLVMRSFSNFSGASRACADFRDPTAISSYNIVSCLF